MSNTETEEFESSACSEGEAVGPMTSAQVAPFQVFAAEVPKTVYEENEDSNVSGDVPYYVIVNGNTVKRVSEEEFHMLEKQQTRTGAEADIEKLKRSFHNDESSSLDNSLGEENNLLAHISREVGIQQQLLCSAMDGTLQDSYDEKGTSQYQVEERASTAATNVSDHYTILPNLLNQPVVHMSASWPHGATPIAGPIANVQPIPVSLSTPVQMPGTILHQQPGGSYVTSTPVSGQRALQTLPMNGQDRCLFTPHPKTGQLLYLAPSDGSSPQLFQHLTPSTTNPSTFVTPNIRDKPGMLKLNSSGEDEENSNNCSSDTPSTPLDSSSERDDMQFELSLFNNTGEESREQHNMKERRRRARIKDACDVMRKLVPGMSDKTDKATVFEFGARYIHFLKGFVGNKHDKDFLIKYSPY